MREDIEARAKDAAGNWARFQAFCWHDRPEDAECWAIFYTHHRDSGLEDLSNAQAIDRVMAPFARDDDPDAIQERHGHWAVGWVGGWAVRVWRDGQITEAFRAWCALQDRMADYPLLDEDDHSRREYEAAIEAIEAEGCSWVREPAPEGWAGEVFSWLSEHNQRECEDDGQGHGPWPSREAVREALRALDMHEDEDE